MELLVWGAGAIGGTAGAYLARAGHTVTFVDRDRAHVEAINQRGLTITGPIDQFTVSAKAFTPDTLSDKHRAVLLCVKAQDTRTATQALAPYLPEDGYVVSLQNGLNELMIADVLGRERTVGAFVNFGADFEEPGVIMFGGRGAVVVGELDGSITPRLTAIHEALLDFDRDAITTENIWGFLWGKLAYGAQLFATAVTDDSIADCLAAPDYRDVYILLAQEVLAVAAAEGITPEAFNGFDPNAFLPDTPRSVSERSLDEMVAFNRRSAKSHSGIWRDLSVRKRRTEVDALMGPVTIMGQERGVPTPLVARLISLIHAIEDGLMVQQESNLDQLKDQLT